jgi:predicted MFS family arabinose efflux permease
MFIGALYVVYGLRELDLTPFLLGVTVGAGGASNLLGTLVVEPVTRRFGLRRTVVGAALVGCCGPLLIGLAPGQTLAGFVFLLAAQALDAHHPLYEVNALTVRQVLTPAQLLGRVNATIHVATRGVIPVGAIAGGVLGDAIGLRPTLLIAALGIILAALWLARVAPTGFPTAKVRLGTPP